MYDEEAPNGAVEPCSKRNFKGQAPAGPGFPMLPSKAFVALAAWTATVAALPLAGLALPDPTAETQVPELPRLVHDLNGLLDETVPVVPAHLPAPTPGNGIGPGSHLILTRPDGTFGCTANFIWSDGANLYLGAAGHCFLPEGTTATHGPGADYNPSQTTTRVCVAACNFGGELGFILTGQMATLGPVAYARQTQAGVDVGNDFGIVRIPANLLGQVRNSLPVWGGPVGSTAPAFGVPVAHYGWAVAFGETFATAARAGVLADGLITDPNTESFTAHALVTFGDSGSPLVVLGTDSLGVHGKQAIGVITHGVPGLAQGTTVAKAIQMATQANLNVQLVNGA